MFHVCRKCGKAPALKDLKTEVYGRGTSWVTKYYCRKCYKKNKKRVVLSEALSYYSCGYCHYFVNKQMV